MIETKNEALDVLEETRKDFIEKCREVGRVIALEKGSVNIDDIREKIKLPEGMNGNVFGAVFRGSEWQHSGFMKSKIKTNHERIIGIYTWKDKVDPHVSDELRAFNVFRDGLTPIYTKEKLDEIEKQKNKLL